MSEITPAQQKHLEAWAEKRDEILRGISALETEKNEKAEQNRKLNEANSEVEKRIFIAEGRLIEIEKKEAERASLISKEILALETQKTELEGKIPALQSEINSLAIEKLILVDSIKDLTLVHGEVFTRTAALEGIVDHVSSVSSKNIVEMEKYLGVLKTSVDEIVAVNKKNVKESMIIIDKLPKAILEYRRPIIPNRIINNKRGSIENNVSKEK